MTATLYTDGGARGNPGPAGVGYVLKISDGKLFEEGAYIGVATNNQAEYEALLRGLRRAVNVGVKNVRVLLDSELVVKQMTGVYRIKNIDLRQRYQAVCQLMQDLQDVQFVHIPRHQNKRADELVNEALDKTARGKS